MKEKNFKLFYTMMTALLSTFMACSAVADENIIQQEKMSFERCLKVIKTSEKKLSIAPEIIDKKPQTRVAMYTLIDGTLTITCKGDEGLVKVSTNMN